MQLSDSELVDFRARCLQAKQRGYSIARAGEYAKALASEVGLDLPGDKLTATDLYDLADAVLKVRVDGGPAPAKAPKAKAAPKPPKAKSSKSKKAKKEEEAPLVVTPEPEPAADPEPVAEDEG